MHHELNSGEIIDFAEARNRRQLGRKRLEIDVERYQAYLDENGLSDEQRSEFVTALWTIMVAFVDLGYGVHPTQSGPADVIDMSASRVPAKDKPQETGEIAHV